MNFGFLVGSRNFIGLFWVSWAVFVLHGYDCIYCVAKSCTTTACRWLFRDSHPSLRTLRSAVIKSPKFSARGTAPPLRLLHGALVILVFWQISQFRSPGKWVYKHCAYPNPHVSWMWALKRLHEKNWRESLPVQELHHPPNFPWILAATPGFQNTTLGFYWLGSALGTTVPVRLHFPKDRECDMRRTGSVSVFWHTFSSTKFPWALLVILADHATSFLVLVRSHHSYLGFRFLLVHATNFFVLLHSYSHFLLMLDEDAVEELVDKPGTTNGT